MSYIETQFSLKGKKAVITGGGRYALRNNCRGVFKSGSGCHFMGTEYGKPYGQKKRAHPEWL